MSKKPTIDPNPSEPASQEFHDWFKNVLDTILIPKASHVVASGETHLPMMLVFSHTDQLAVIPMIETDNISKDIYIAFQRLCASNPGIVKAAVAIHEAWVLALPAPNKPTQEEFDRVTKEYRHGDLEQHPQRQEAMLFNAMQDKQQLLAIAHIIRPDNKLRPYEIIDPLGKHSFGGGRMINERPQRH